MTRFSAYHYSRVLNGGIHDEELRNVTITLPEDVARWLRVRAAVDYRSVSGWIAELLGRMRREEDEYQAAMRSALARQPVKLA